MRPTAWDRATTTCLVRAPCALATQGSKHGALQPHTHPVLRVRAAPLRAAGSYTPFARGIMNSLKAQSGKARKPTAMRVGEASISLQPPPGQVPRNQRKFIQIGARAKSQPKAKEKDEVTLDGFLLLDACHVEDPDDAVQAVLEGAGITSAVPEDLAFFTRLTHLDVGDNRLQLDRLAGLPNLQELHIDCNGIISIGLPAGGFPRLEVLNLSYNGLRAEQISNLAQLACLRELDLTGKYDLYIFILYIFGSFQ
ncbi:hypothetical protein T492DRAFT_843109 [Pavlovales sp. CCMP2436]|nr:hypothetical protein T492DRAFT_843109 [Pavlovales sp. CCMP2436]